MQNENNDFQLLIRQVREGSQEAAWDLIERYGNHIQRFVRRRLPSALRQKFDSEDFIQSAWASIFMKRSRLVRFQDQRT